MPEPHKSIFGASQQQRHVWCVLDSLSFKTTNSDFPSQAKKCKMTTKSLRKKKKKNSCNEDCKQKHNCWKQKQQQQQQQQINEELQVLMSGHSNSQLTHMLVPGTIQYHQPGLAIQNSRMHGVASCSRS